jgi:hypothetical protein
VLRRHSWSAALSCAAALIATTPGLARAQAALDRDIDLTTLRLPPGPDAVIGAEGSAVLRPGRLAVGAALRWIDQPLVLRDATGAETAAPVNGRLGLDLGLAVGVTRWLELGLLFPAVLFQDGDALGADARALSTAGTGDLRLRAKFAVRSSASHIFGFGVVVEGFFPTALRGSFLGDGAPGFEAMLVGDFRMSLGAVALHLALDVGYRFRPERHFGDLDVDDELVWRVGLRVGLPRDVALLGDVGGAHGLLGPDGPFGAQDENPILWHLGLELPPVADVRFALGAGMGVTSGYGAPRFDAFFDVRYQPQDHDTDEDGVLDHADRCVELPEDADGFQDEDGCPDEDNDGDGIQDFIDACPDEAEDVDQSADEDGCPETDGDGDGVPDEADACVAEPEDVDGYRDEDGCPDLDADGDGLDAPGDACDDRPEDVDGFEDADGCPDPDNDGDGIADEADQCPDGPEDLDGFEDVDGCADDDNDRDGVLDVQDRCPQDAEDDDDTEDDDGCPERAGRIRAPVQ